MLMFQLAHPKVAQPKPEHWPSGTDARQPAEKPLHEVTIQTLLDGK